MAYGNDKYKSKGKFNNGNKGHKKDGFVHRSHGNGYIPPKVEFAIDNLDPEGKKRAKLIARIMVAANYLKQKLDLFPVAKRYVNDFNAERNEKFSDRPSTEELALMADLSEQRLSFVIDKIGQSLD